MINLRSYVYIDKLQKQLAGFIGKMTTGDVPTYTMASLWIEVQPGIEVNKIIDIMLKTTSVRPAVHIEEREYGILEVHSLSQEEVKQSGNKFLDSYNIKEINRIQPKIYTSQTITNITAYHAQILSRSCKGSLPLAGESLYILEVSPAVNIVLSANEAEKAADIKLLHLRARGRFGRLYLSGTEANVKAAQQAAEKAIKDLKSI